MSEPLPCPFCGHVGVTHTEGSTFRWLVTECDKCGAQCEEERINTLSKDRGAAISQAKKAAIQTWNTRVALEQQAEPGAQSDLIRRLRDTASRGVSVWGDLQMAAAREIEVLAAQQAEPVSMRLPKVGDKVICLEDESLGEVVSLTAGGSPDITFDDGSRGTYLLREFAELFGYAEQRQQQAEPPPEWPLVKNILDEYGLDAIAFVAAWKAAQQQAEGGSKTATLPSGYTKKSLSETAHITNGHTNKEKNT